MMYLIAGLIGSYLYALRGGNYFREGESTFENRLIYILPLGWLVAALTSAAIPSLIFTALTFGAIALGHGLAMDMGRFKPTGPGALKKEHELPFTWIIGAENYAWPFWKSWVHNLTLMSLIGLMRHTPIWVFYQTVELKYLIAYTIAGLLHGILYELGHQMGRWFNLLKLRPSQYTLYAEHFVGFLMVIGLCLTLTR